MTFTTSIKEEISKLVINDVEDRFELIAFLNCVGKFTKDELIITMENAAVARRIYLELKKFYNISPKIIIRLQKRFKVKQIYILSIKEKLDFIKESMDIGNRVNIEELVTDEEKIAFLKGAFLAVGNISNPSTSGYHMEFVFKKSILAKQVKKILNYFKINAKLIKREYKNMVYIKSGEEISDIIKSFKATNSLFYFEDIRIYRDHKNMVNRLNNCEIANQEKTLKAGMKQLDNIKYLKEKDLFDLLDEKTQLVMEYREKYPENSYQELADIISMETDYKIGKSGVNHHFIKVNDLIKKYQNRKK